MLTLQLIRSRSSEGHGLIYTNFVELHCRMLHAKFQNHRPYGSGKEDFIFKGFATYSHGGNNFCSPFLRMLHIKFGFDWPSGFRGDVSLNIVDNNDYNDDGRWSMGIL